MMTIQLLYRYLDHDVRQLTTRYAEARAQEPEAKDLAQLGDGDSDQQLIMRLVVTGVGRLRAVLGDKVETVSGDSDDTLPDASGNTRPHRDKWEFTFKKTTADSRALAEIMHWLVVRAAIAEWCRMFSPTDTAEAKAETEELEADLDELLSRPAIPVKERRRIVLEDAPTEITYTFIP